MSSSQRFSVEMSTYGNSNDPDVVDGGADLMSKSYRAPVNNGVSSDNPDDAKPEDLLQSTDHNTKHAWYDGVDNVSEGTTHKSTIEQWANQFQLYMFQVMFFNSYGMTYNAFLGACILLVEFLQMFDFILRFEIFHINSTPLDWLKQITSVMTFRQTGMYMQNSVVLIAFITVWLTVIAIVFTQWTIRTNSFNDYPTRRVLRILLPLYPIFLFIPFFTIFMELLRCEASSGTRLSVWADSSCGSISHILLIFFSIPTSIALILITYFVLISHTDTAPTSLSVLSMSHTRIEQLRLLVCLILCIVLGPMRFLDSSRPLLLALVVTAGFVTVLVLRLVHLPHHRFEWALAAIARDTIIAWSGVLTIIAAAHDNAEFMGVAAGLLWTQPFVVGSVLILATTRKWHLTMQHPAAISSPYTLELYIRFVMARLHKHLYTQSFEHTRRYTLSQYDSVVQTCEDVYRHHMKHASVRSSMAYYFFAQFTFEFRGNYHCAHRYAHRALEHASLPDTHFLIYKLHQLIEMHYQTRVENREILSYIAYEHHTMLAAKHDASASKHQLQFWTLLAKPKPDLQRLNHYAVTIAEQNKLALHNYQKVLAINPQSSHCMRMYASFLLDVMQDKQLAQQQLDFAQYADEASRLVRNTGAGTSQSSLFDDKSAIIVISGDDADLGTIKKSNARANMLLGWSSTELQGRHATSLFAEPYATLFSRYIYCYQDHGHPLDAVSDAMMVCQHKSQFVFPAYMQLRKFVEKGHMRVLVLLEHIKPVQSVCTVIVSDQGYVHGMSANAASLFGVDSVTIAKISAANALVGASLSMDMVGSGAGSGTSGDASSRSKYGSGKDDGMGNMEEAVDGLGGLSARQPLAPGSSTSPTAGGTVTAAVGHASGHAELSLVSPLHMTDVIPNYVSTVWTPLQEASRKLQAHPLIDGTLDLDTPENYYHRRHQQQVAQLKGRYQRTTTDSDNASIRYTFHTADGYFREEEDDPFLHNDRRYHDLSLYGLSINPYVRQCLLDAPLADRTSSSRERNPFYALQTQQPRVKCDYFPRHRPEAWSLNVQCVHISGATVPLYLLAIYPTAKPLVLPVIALPPKGEMPVPTPLSKPTPTNRRFFDFQSPQGPNVTFDGGLNNYRGDGAATHGELSTEFMRLAEEIGSPHALAALTEERDQQQHGLNLYFGDEEEEEVMEQELIAPVQRRDEDPAVTAPLKVGEGEEEEAVEDTINLGDDMGIYADDDDDNNEGIKISERLRKEVLQDHEGIVKGLLKFRRIFIVSIIIVCACALSMFIVSIVMMSSYQDDLVFLNEQTQRNLYFSNAARAAHSMVMINVGIYDGSVLIPYSDMVRDGSAATPPLTDQIVPDFTLEDYTRGALSETISLLESVALDLNRVVQSSSHTWRGTGGVQIRSGSFLSNPTIDAYTGTHLSVHLIYPNTYDLYDVPKSMLEMMGLTIGQAMYLSLSQTYEFVPYQASVYHMLANTCSQEIQAQGSVFDRYLDEDTQNTVFVLDYIIIALVVAPIVILFGVIVLILRPTIFEIEESKSQVILVFLDIPTNIVLQLKQIYTRRVESFQTSLSSPAAGSLGAAGIEEEEDNDVNFDDDDDEGRRSYGNKVVPFGESVQSQQQQQQSELNFSSDKYLFLFKICLLFVLAVIYFLVIYFTGIYSIRPHLENAPSLIRVSSHRNANLALAAHYTTVLTTHSSQGYLMPSHWIQPYLAKDIWTESQALENSLIYGDADAGVTGISESGYYGGGSSSDEFTLVYENGCVDSPTLPEASSYCPSFYNGVMMRGSHAATLEFIELGETILALALDQIKTMYWYMTATPPLYQVNPYFATPDDIPDEYTYPSPVYIADAFSAYMGTTSTTLPALNEWHHFYLAPAYAHHNDLYLDSVDAHVYSVTQIQLILLIVFVSLTVLTYFSVYVPLIHLLDTQIKRTRSMLLMIPADVLESIPAARLILQNKQTVL